MDPLPPVFIDATQFQQVLINLMVNAKDAMAQQGVLRIESRWAHFQNPAGTFAAGPVAREGDPRGVDFRLLRKTSPAVEWPFLEGQELVEIMVSDTGSGIAQADLARVFDPFFTTKEAGKGTGLGLSVCQRIIQSFYGQILIESQVGKGTGLIIRLPAAIEHEKQEGIHPQAIKEVI